MNTRKYMIESLNKYIRESINEDTNCRTKKMYSYFIDLKKLKEYSNTTNIYEEKDIIDIFEIKKEYNISITCNYLQTRKTYEIFLSISDDKQIASMLLYKEIKFKILSILYFYKLKLFVSYSRVNKIVDKVKLYKK